MATTVSSPTTPKRCQKCGKDVTGQRRMKDPRGQYWCYECGSADEASKGSGATLVQPCPVCKKPVHAMNMVRNKKSGLYVCDECASAGKGSKGGSDGPPKNIKLYVALGVIAVIAAVYWYMNMRPA
ncbi:MAG: hypothetical protein QM770_09890 [Tepidisphaeraceae bacterium]